MLYNTQGVLSLRYILCSPSIGVYHVGTYSDTLLYTHIYKCIVLCNQSRNSVQIYLWPIWKIYIEYGIISRPATVVRSTFNALRYPNIDPSSMGCLVVSTILEWMRMNLRARQQVEFVTHIIIILEETRWTERPRRPFGSVSTSEPYKLSKQRKQTEYFWDWLSGSNLLVRVIITGVY